MQAIIIGAIGPLQVGLVILLILILFGGAKLPSLAKNIGKSINEFKKATKGESEDTPEEPKKEA